MVYILTTALVLITAIIYFRWIVAIGLIVLFLLSFLGVI